MGCYRLEPGAIVVTVRLTPHAARDAIEGLGRLADGQAVAHARVRALPEDGAANTALIALLAKAFRRPKSSVELVSGQTARVKQVRIAGHPAELVRIVDSWPTKK